MKEEKPESRKFRVIIYHLSEIREFDTLEEAFEEDVSISRFSPETISFVDGKKPEWEDLRVCYSRPHYHPLNTLARQR